MPMPRRSDIRSERHDPRLRPWRHHHKGWTTGPALGRSLVGAAEGNALPDRRPSRAPRVRRTVSKTERSTRYPRPLRVQCRSVRCGQRHWAMSVADSSYHALDGSRTHRKEIKMAYRSSHGGYRGSSSHSGGFTKSNGVRVSSTRAHQHTGQTIGGYTKTRTSSGGYRMTKSK